MNVDFRTAREKKIDSQKERFRTLLTRYKDEASKQGITPSKTRLYGLISKDMGITLQGVYAFVKRHKLEDPCE